MNAAIGWGLAVLAVSLAWWQYGWRGVALAVSVIVFWLLLQFSRALRVMRDAGRRPLGRVPSAVMLQARLRRGMRLIDVVPLAGSLGESLLADAPDQERWRWTDEAGDRVELRLQGGRVQDWTLQRASPADQADRPNSGPAASTAEDAGDGSPAASAGTTGSQARASGKGSGPSSR